MKSLVVVLACCGIAAARDCPKTTPVTDDDVINAPFENYALYGYRKPTSVNIEDSVSHKCTVRLQVRGFYVIGYKDDLRFVRKYSELTEKERNQYGWKI
ncbi:hypothetical protein Y032_0528g2975 [Ancylostoma ceylanicum]|nr:hypothetical protein Y032_0528g2975 [Ancylostoma ceylanicum]